jgi:hypothetical protein
MLSYRLLEGLLAITFILVACSDFLSSSTTVQKSILSLIYTLLKNITVVGSDLEPQNLVDFISETEHVPLVSSEGSYFLPNTWSTYSLKCINLIMLKTS